MIFPASDEATGVVEPGKEAFDLPAAPRAAKRAAILRAGPTVRAIAAIISMPYVSRRCASSAIAVVAAVADQPRRELSEEARIERGGDERGVHTAKRWPRARREEDHGGRRSP